MHVLLKISVPVSLFLFLAGCMPSPGKNSGNTGQAIAEHETEAGDTTTYAPVRPDIYDISELHRLLRSADRVVAYNFNGNNANSANVECDDLYTSGKLCRSATNERVLTPAQTDTLIAIATDTSTYDGKWSGIYGVCYIPHVGFGFFRGDSLVAQVSVCFLCGGVRTRPYYKSDGYTEAGYARYKALAQQLELKIVDHTSHLTY